MYVHTFPPDKKLLPDIILSHQVHGTRIGEIVTGNEDLFECDGIWTRNPMFKLGIRTADCAPICFWDEAKFGIVHVGWRGLCGGICEKMLDVFNDNNVYVFVGPMLSVFEIQRNFCYAMIKEKFDEQFFEKKGDRILFDFEGAIRSVLPMAEFDGRNTFEDRELASWRRDGNEQRNITVIRARDKIT